jgi:LysR family transcriptional regulator, benzoate and cis,cis-muconate-responsive activator of ben and cat genes
VFLKQSWIVLSHAAEAAKAAQAADGSGKRLIQIGYVPSLTVKVLPPILRAFTKKAPGVRVNLHDLTTPE